MAAGRAIDSVRCVEWTAANLAHAETKRRGYLEKENSLISLSDLQKFIESKVHTEVIDDAMKLAAIESYEECCDEATKLYTRKEVFQLQCHLAVLLTMHTGKRQGILCGIKIGDINSNTDNVMEFRDESNPDEVSYQFKVVPSCEYAVFKTIPVAYVNVCNSLLTLLETLGFLRLEIDCCFMDHCIFTSFTQVALLDIDVLMKKAWSDASLKSRFNSTMMQHMIVTQARDPENKLDVEELKALARGMDHSICIAESTYYHEKERAQIDHSKIIERVLKLNDWNEEIEVGMEEEIEKDIMTGEVKLLEADKDQDEDEDDAKKDEEGEPSTKKRKIGNMEVIFTEHQTKLVGRLFRKYIDNKVDNPSQSIWSEDIKGLYNKKMSSLSSSSPFAYLFQFDLARIVTKVCTLITQGK